MTHSAENVQELVGFVRGAKSVFAPIIGDQLERAASVMEAQQARIAELEAAQRPLSTQAEAIQWRNINKTERMGWREARDMTVATRTAILKQRLAERWNTRPSVEPKPDSQWVLASERLPESAMTEVLVLQMFFEEDGTPRNIFKGDTTLPLMRNVAKAHCHKDDNGLPIWRGRDGMDMGLITRKGWVVVAWQYLPPTDEFCATFIPKGVQ
jgi:hypothetical protein